MWSSILKSVLGEGQGREALAGEMAQWQREAVDEFHTWLRVPGLLRLRGEELPEGTSLACYARGLARMYRAVAEGDWIRCTWVAVAKVVLLLSTSCTASVVSMSRGIV